MVLGIVCFGKAESTTTTHPVSWLLAGLAGTAGLAFTGACLTLGRRRWREVALYALIVSCLASAALFAVSSVSTSRGCNNGGQPRSAGTYDCDTSDAIGGPLVLALVYAPLYGLSALGKGVGALTRRVSA